MPTEQAVLKSGGYVGNRKLCLSNLFPVIRRGEFVVGY